MMPPPDALPRGTASRWLAHGQARIRTFPLDDPDAAMYAPDVVSFAQSKGLYPQVRRTGDSSTPHTTQRTGARWLSYSRTAVCAHRMRRRRSFRSPTRTTPSASSAHGSPKSGSGLSSNRWTPPRTRAHAASHKHPPTHSGACACCRRPAERSTDTRITSAVITPSRIPATPRAFPDVRVRMWVRVRVWVWVCVGVLWACQA
jgi:hypothetical protein